MPTFEELFVQQVALARSRERKLRRLKTSPDYLDGLPSSKDEMLNDTLDARAFLALKIVDGEIPFTHVLPASYPLLEEVWLRRVKQMKAYYIWKAGSTGTPEGDFHAASKEIRNRVLNGPRSDIRDFEVVKAYFRNCYLGKRDALDENKAGTKGLIAGKAERIWRTTGEARAEVNWLRAKLYVTMFYESIIGAVCEEDPQKTATIMKAFEFSKSPENRYLVVNGLETIVTIAFLNKDVVQSVLRRPELFDFNLVPVENWPADVAAAPECNGKFWYDKEDKQIIYEGIMPQKERDALLALLPRTDCRAAVERLFQQSRLHPLEDMIL